MLNPAEIYEKLVTLGEEWADANCAADLLEETKKTLISQLGQDSNAKSMSERESYALRHDDYMKHIKAMTNARKLSNKAKVRYDSAKIYSELLRTQQANERAAMKTAV